jgi:hypothetical protein
MITGPPDPAQMQWMQHRDLRRDVLCHSMPIRHTKRSKNIGEVMRTYDSPGFSFFIPAPGKHRGFEAGRWWIGHVITLPTPKIIGNMAISDMVWQCI